MKCVGCKQREAIKGSDVCEVCKGMLIELWQNRINDCLKRQEDKNA